jgi:hypothetical protein
MKIAERTGLSLRQAKRQHSAREFLLWQEQFSREITEETHREDYHAASICWEIYQIRVMLGSKQKFKWDDFLIKFKDKEKEEEVIDPEAEKVRLRNMGMEFKKEFMAMLGLDPDGNKTKNFALKPPRRS